MFVQIYTSIAERLMCQHRAAENIIFNSSTNRLLMRPKPGKWNIHDNIAHLARYQDVFMERINQILQQDQPSFFRYKAEEDPAFEDWRTLDTVTLIDRLDLDRKELYSLVMNLSHERINRIGIHQKFGALTIIEWTEFFLLHRKKE